MFRKLWIHSNVFFNEEFCSLKTTILVIVSAGSMLSMVSFDVVQCFLSPRLHRAEWDTNMHALVDTAVLPGLRRTALWRSRHMDVQCRWFRLGLNDVFSWILREKCIFLCVWVELSVELMGFKHCLVKVRRFACHSVGMAPGTVERDSWQFVWNCSVQVLLISRLRVFVQQHECNIFSRQAAPGCRLGGFHLLTALLTFTYIYLHSCAQYGVSADVFFWKDGARLWPKIRTICTRAPFDWHVSILNRYPRTMVT